MSKKVELYRTPLGDKVQLFQETVVISFKGRRNVVSTSVLNGGYREDLQFAFNNSCGRNNKADCHKMKGDSLEGHYMAIALELGLDPDRTTGVGTAALMENMATVTKSHGPLTVSAMVTAGIDVNGGRAGDPAAYDELTKTNLLEKEVSGTINMFLNINARLPEGTLTRALMTATEAKTAALQELMANSSYSDGLATGSGTDAAIIISDLDSDIYLTNAGKHVVLGELIGTSVKEAVKEALKLQAGMNEERQSRLSYQAKRYGFNQEEIKKECSDLSGFKEGRFAEAFANVDGDKKITAPIAACIHLVDQYKWGILDKDSVKHSCLVQLNALRDQHGLDPFMEKEIVEGICKKSFRKCMIDHLKQTLAEIINKKI